MSEAGESRGRSSGDLADAMRGQAEAEVRATNAAAQSEAQAVIATAKREARTRLRKAVQAMRADRQASLQKANARLLAAERRHRHETETALLDQAMIQLRSALSERWKDAEAQRRWCMAAIAYAGDRLESGIWKVELPKSAAIADDKELGDALRTASANSPNLVTDETIEAGIRISVSQSCLDATLEGLLIRHDWVAAELLAMLDDATSNKADAS